MQRNKKRQTTRVALLQARCLTRTREGTTLVGTRELASQAFTCTAQLCLPAPGLHRAWWRWSSGWASLKCDLV